MEEEIYYSHISGYRVSFVATAPIKKKKTVGMTEKQNKTLAESVGSWTNLEMTLQLILRSQISKKLYTYAFSEHFNKSHERNFGVSNYHLSHVLS